MIPETPFNWKIEVNKIPDEGRAHLRLYPLKAAPALKTALEARTIASKGGLRPMGADLSGWTPGRNVYGAIVYESPADGKLYHLTQLFLNRELWGVDALAVNASRCRDFMRGESGGFIMSAYVERVFTETLSNYLPFAQKSLQLPPPLQIEAGLSGIKDYPIAIQQGITGRVLRDVIQWTGAIPSYDIPAEDVLRPFFDYVWAECGIIRPGKYHTALEEQFS